MNLAVIKTGGKQYLVQADQKLKIEKLDRKEGEEFDFDKVLLFARGKPRREAVGAPTEASEEIKIGQPYIEGMKVRAKVLKQGRGEKKIVFRYKAKTRYKKKKSHRQLFTEVQILSIS